MILLKVGLPEKLEDAVIKLGKVTESAQLESILNTLLEDAKIDQDYITNIRNIKNESKVTEEAKIILDLIAIGQLQKFLMHTENQILLQQMEVERKRKQAKSNIQNQLLGIRDYLRPKYKPVKN